MHELNPSIRDIPIPANMRKLPIGPNGYPVPWFVAWLDGKPEFRVADSEKQMLAVHHRRCWVCGERLNNRVTHVIGPMCSVNRVSSEPPSHPECAIYSARACPFLTRPGMVRRDNDLPEGTTSAGEMITRNPGAMCLWTTKAPGFEIITDGRNGRLFYLFEPTEVRWMAEGRAATRAEVEASIASGYPFLTRMADEQGLPAIMELNKMVAAARKYLPE